MFQEKSGFWASLIRPSSRFSVLTLLLVGIVLGLALIAGTHLTFEATSSPEFCSNSCHEMQTPVAEYQQSPHYSNRSGVRAHCADCHIPKQLLPKLETKVKSSAELWGKITGSLDTPEKFAARRLELAQHEWARMKANDSRECRNCHTVDGMSAEKQTPRATAMHALIGEDGRTCIDCHKGIAHHLPDNMPEGD
ncbi:Denitrification system component NirT [Rhodocyclus tenuis]|uniref:Cytochrome c-type protein n=2 Tax=Rhodocyclus TaxID=1064 RepID=A0A6L5JX53_RHOTE|nr:NapC/NirT family cytochrome c [Rhodocyclus gracilis]MQY51402.1 Denitrification system component NirT [Rhodocyclus gracilis]MRD72144.1 Denitrification system component NirT [Rhodocyclus gracilis]NJA89250.1 Denitrification system component NirT [Rhodocyclus gracilis]